MADVAGYTLTGAEPGDMDVTGTPDDVDSLAFSIFPTANVITTKRKEPIIATERDLVFEPAP